MPLKVCRIQKSKILNFTCELSAIEFPHPTNLSIIPNPTVEIHCPNPQRFKTTVFVFVSNKKYVCGAILSPESNS